MPTTTRSRLRALLGRATGLFFASTTTSLAADTVTVVDTAVQRYNTTLLPNKWVHITSGAQVGVDRRITSVSGSTITITPAYAAAIASGVTYEILEYDPDYYHDALQEAGRTTYPFLYLQQRDETLIVDNLLLNPDFETGTFTNWTNSGAGLVVSADTTTKMHGAQSAKMVAGSAVGQMYQDIYLSMNERQTGRKSIHFHGWARATAASSARLRISFDGGTTYTNGVYHTGDGTWIGPERMWVQAAIPTNATSVRCVVEAAANATVWFDLVWAWVDPIFRYTIPGAFISGPHRVYQQRYMSLPDGPYDPLGIGNMAKSGLLLRLEGQGRLTVPTTDTGTMEIDENRSELVVAQAGEYLFLRLAGIDPGARDQHLVRAKLFQDRTKLLMKQPGIRALPMSSHAHDSWGITEDSSGRYLNLEAR